MLGNLNLPTLGERLLEYFDIRRYFSAVIGPEKVSRNKPDPEMMLKVMSELGAEPEKTLVVGDSHLDVLAGKRAGAHTCGVTYGIGDLKELVRAEPDFLICSLSGLTLLLC
ncbi:phosphoglycolate phosphatase/pyrophosphatase PpaX [Thermosediminibacter litoriperuensis]|uniref:Phosphoglycolate phosphatase/pyrophosphatase PpaX n=2 Tax=Thermosediminibacter litoriperuensis TaxID=291989 RepID=A0A5S5ASR6_9FIRM|nr:phosphoglycolate phosphatase/pyrophosphatase PpaX [Thermosediminibacter litoriperuensis]